MELEFKILAYILLIHIILYIAAKIEYWNGNTSTKFEYYSGIITELYHFWKLMFAIILFVYVFIQFTNYLFQGELFKIIN